MPSALDKLFADAGLDEARESAADQRSALLKKTMTPAMRKLYEQQEDAKNAALTGEDARITQYHRALDSPVMKTWTPAMKDKYKSDLQATFLAKNPDLNPNAPKPEPTQAEKLDETLDATVQQIVKLAVAGGPKTMAAGKLYHQIKDQITPEMRTKYNLDKLEEYGLLKKGEQNRLAQGVGAVARPLLNASARVGSTGIAIAEQGRIGFKQAIGKELTDEEKVTKTYGGFKRDIDKHIGGGEIINRTLAGIAGEEGKTVEILGHKVRGVRNADGGFTFEPTEGDKGFENLTSWEKFKSRNWDLMVAQLTGAGLDTGLDVQNYMGGTGAAAQMKVAGKAALEAENLGGVWAKISKAGGVKNLSEAEHAAALAAITKHTDEASKVVAKAGSKDAAAESVMKGVEAQGQRGLKFGGRTVLPVPARKGTREAIEESARLEVADTLRASEVGRGAVLRDVGDGVVHEWDEVGRRAVIEPKGRMAVLRDGIEQTVDVDEVKAGDRLLDDGATVLKVDDATKKLTVEVDDGVDSFKVIPKAEAETLAAADRSAKARSIMEEQKRAAATKYDRQGAINQIDEAIERIKGAERITEDLDDDASENLLRLANLKAPKGADEVVHASLGGGDQFVARNADGEAVGIIGIANGKVETLYIAPSARGTGLSSKLYAAADEAGMDVANLTHDGMTEAGQRARISYLKAKRKELAGKGGSRADEARSKVARGKSARKKIAIDRPRYKPDLHPALTGATRPDEFNVAIRRPSGTQDGRRLWRVRDSRKMVNEGWELTAPQVDSAGHIIPDSEPIVLAKVTGWTETADGPRLVLDTTGTGNLDLIGKQVGDEVPEFAGVVTKRTRNGAKFELRAMTQEEFDAAKAAGAPDSLNAMRARQNASEAIDPSSGATVPPGTAKATAGTNAADPELYTPQAPRTPYTPSARDQIVRGGKRRAVTADALAPRAGVEGAERVNTVAGGTAAKILTAQSAERAAIGTTTKDLGLRTQSVRDRLVKVFGNTRKGRNEAQKFLEDALDVGAGGRGRSEEMLAAAEAAGETEKAAALRTAMDIRDDVAQIGMSPEEIARATPPSQMPLITTHDGAETLADVPQLATSVFGPDHAVKTVPGFDWTEDLAGASSVKINSPEIVEHLRRIPEKDLPKLIRRTEDGFEIRMTGSVKETNEAFNSLVTENFRVKLGLKPGESVKFFHEAPMTAYSIRSQAAHRIAIEAETTMRLADEGVVHLITTDAGRLAASGDGLVRVPGMKSPIGEVWAPKELVPELNRLNAVTRNADQLKSFKRTVDQATALWTKQVLSPITKGLSYPLRNAMSNTINAVFGGLTVGGQREANRLQMGVMRKTAKIMREEGLSHEAALARVTGDLTGRDALLIQYLREDNIVNSGLYRSLDSLDAAGDVAHKDATGVKAAVKRGLDPRSPENILFKPGRAVNTVIEDNARMALYISVFDRTGSRAAAREAVAKYLFDYADLTPFESNVLKTANAFWTFTRKNTALQVKLLADRPQLAANTFRLKQELYDPDPDNQGLLYPGENKEGFGVAGKVLQGAMGGQGVVRIDDPVTSAFQALDPVILAAYAGIATMPGGDKFVKNLPPSEQPTFKNISRGVLGNTAGMPAALATFIFEEAAGVDVEKGRELKAGEAKERFREAMVPLFGQKDNVVGTLGPAFGMSSDETKMRTNLLRLLSGITFYRRDDEKSNRNLVIAMSMELQATLDQMEAADIKVPTMQMLQDADIVPSTAELNKLKPKPRTISLTPAQKQKAARDQVAEIRRSTGAG